MTSPNASHCLKQVVRPIRGHVWHSPGPRIYSQHRLPQHADSKDASSISQWCSGFLPGIFSGRQNLLLCKFFVMLTFLLFSDQISGGQKSPRGANCLRGAPCERKPVLATRSLLPYFAHIVSVKFAHPHPLIILTEPACHHNSFWRSRCDRNQAHNISLKP